VPQRSTNDEDPEQPSTIGNRQPGASGVLALVRREDQEAMNQLAASHQDIEICATADEFVAKCANSQYQVAILPSRVLPPDWHTRFGHSASIVPLANIAVEEKAEN
jgi:hypothetical protein